MKYVEDCRVVGETLFLFAFSGSCLPRFSFLTCFFLVVALQLLPSNKELLHTAQSKNWIPTILTWLNLHDRPAVQVEALLALTNIAELCAQQSYFGAATAHQNANAAAAAAAVAAQQSAAAVSAITAAAAAKAGVATAASAGISQASWNDAMEAATKLAAASGTNPTSSLAASSAAAASAPGSVPFPPLSFSQTLSPEAVAAFDASLTTTIAGSAPSDASNNSTSNSSSTKSDKRNNNNNNKLSVPPAPLFPSNPAGAAAGTTGINFTSLAPPPGGAHTSVPSNAFLPPPTPVTAPNFPQQLSASSQHLLLRHADAIPTLISLLSSPNKEVYEQACWILGSIAAGDSPTGGSSSGTGGGSSSASSTSALDGGSGVSRDKSVSARDVILAAGVMNHLLRCLENHADNLSIQRIGSWTLSNLVDGIFQQSPHGATGASKNGGGKTSANNNDFSSADEIDMSTLLPVLRRLLRMSDAEVLGYTCWTLSHLCDGPSSHIGAVVTTPKNLKQGPDSKPGGLVPRLVELLMHQSWRVTKPALRTIGNIVCAECSDDNQAAGAAGSAGPTTTDYTEVILECDAVPRLKELILHSNREIQKEACWTLSNIAAGTVDQIQAVIDSGAIPPLVKLVRDKGTDQEVRSEACWVVLNATSCGSDSQIEVLVDEGCVSVLGVLLSEASMVMMALEGLERVLQVEETREVIRREKVLNGETQYDASEYPTLVSASLIEKARDSHNSTAVTKRADRIWKQHFVSCALCKKSFSKHRTSDASFCEECKCHVCSNCNCKIYHLDYQEELWAASEEKTEAKKNAKKSKNKKKKAKLKEKKAKQQQEEEEQQPRATVAPNDNKKIAPDLASDKKEGDKASNKKESDKSSPSASFEDDDDADDNDEFNIDFVLYLQQTGSIIALSKLMDALEDGGQDGDELNEYERKMIQQQQEWVREQATNSAH